ncbi:SDR family oxidoreductase [Vibrio ezurae]|uniref:Putative oxidoreductase n=1 Tax=Vibrio ezurae NBRC 102218 TaxID=1219080 RepID=U3CJ99_9VIBR|nr:SDR family oxidoreductase [Vibrio ezurae]GAD81229.1 putative oxidoreductase [Vibrio ezurae NBRC 102218]
MVIRNSVVLITSAGTILGKTLALHFASLGAKVVITDKRASRLKDTYRDCLAAGFNVCTYALPDDSQEHVDSLFYYIETYYNQGVDILINNWQNPPLPTLVSTAPAEEFSAQFSNIVQSLFSCGHACAEQMRRNDKQGVIINILTNDSAQMILGTESTCSMVSGLTKSWAKELNPFDIRVGAILPSVHHCSYDDYQHSFANIRQDVIRNTEYIVSNDSFNGRVMSW